MRMRLYTLFWTLTLMGSGLMGKPTYGEIRTSWDSLPFVQLPALESQLYEQIVLDIVKVPPHAYGQLDSYGACASRCQWECDVSEQGKMRFEILNAFGYGPSFAPCGLPIRIEFGSVNAGKQVVHCTLQLHVEGSRILPLVRIGEVITRVEGPDAYDADTLVYIYPQIELIYKDEQNPIWVKPHWRAKIEGEGFEPIFVEGWNDCCGPTKGPRRRSPCKPNPIPLSMLRPCKGVVKITFDREVLAYAQGDAIELEFESSNLSFWYDLLNDRPVER